MKYKGDINFPLNDTIHYLRLDSSFTKCYLESMLFIVNARLFWHTKKQIINSRRYLKKLICFKIILISLSELKREDICINVILYTSTAYFLCILNMSIGDKLE